MKLLAVITLPIAILGFAHASVHVSPHVSSHTSVHSSSHAGTHTSPHVSKHGSTSKAPSVKAKTSNAKSSYAKSSSNSFHFPFLHWWGNSHQNKKDDDVNSIKREIKSLNKSEQKKIKKYVDVLVK